MSDRSVIGSRAVFRGRSLALRPRLTTGLRYRVTCWGSSVVPHPKASVVPDHIDLQVVVTAGLAIAVWIVDAVEVLSNAETLADGERAAA